MHQTCQDVLLQANACFTSEMYSFRLSGTELVNFYCCSSYLCSYPWTAVFPLSAKNAKYFPAFPHKSFASAKQRVLLINFGVKDFRCFFFLISDHTITFFCRKYQVFGMIAFFLRSFFGGSTVLQSLSYRVFTETSGYLNCTFSGSYAEGETQREHCQTVSNTSFWTIHTLFITMLLCSTYVLGEIHTCLGVSSAPSVFFEFLRIEFVAGLKLPSRNNHHETSFPKTQQHDQGVG